MKHKILRAFLIIALCLIFSSMTAGYAHADAIMFPWVIKTDTVSTIISVVNTAQGDPILDDTLHLQYYYKVPQPNTNDVNHPENLCNEYDFLCTISENDIVSFDASGIINGGLPLWNDDDPFHPNDPIFVNDFALPVEGPVIAYLLVDNNTQSFVEEGTNVDGTLYGEALIVDVQSGTLWGYTAYNSRYTETATDFNDQVYFDDGKDFQGEVIDEAEHGWTVLLPPSDYETRFLITPVSLLGQRSRIDLNAQIYLARDTSGAEGGIFLNNETPIDFVHHNNVVCTAALELKDMMITAVYNVFKDSGNQGWAYVKTLYGTATQELTDEAVIGKLERSDVLIYDGCQDCKDICISNCKVPQFNLKSPLICDRMCTQKCKNVCKYQKRITISPDNFTWIRSSDSILEYFLVQ
jgi:hypothetical protein